MHCVLVNFPYNSLLSIEKWHDYCIMHKSISNITMNMFMGDLRIFLILRLQYVQTQTKQLHQKTSPFVGFKVFFD